MKILPQTKLGKWGIGFAVLWPVLVVVGSIIANEIYAGVEAGNGIIDDLRVRPLLPLTMLLAVAVGLASLPLNLVAIFKKGEHSILSMLATLLGLFLILILVGEIFFEH